MTRWVFIADLKRFKRVTTGHTIIMGRLTWESIGSKALPNRRNIVISHNPVEGAECYTSIDQAVTKCDSEDIWFIGGGQIYRAAFALLNLLDVTWVPDTVTDPNAVTFPEIKQTEWTLTDSAPLEDNPDLINSIYQRI